MKILFMDARHLYCPSSHHATQNTQYRTHINLCFIAPRGSTMNAPEYFFIAVAVAVTVFRIVMLMPRGRSNDTSNA